MAKGKSTSSGPHKNHGPKKHMHAYTGPMKWQFGKMGVLSKYWDYEAWQQACTAKGKRNATYSEFKSFFVMDMDKKKEYFANLSK